MWLEVYAENHSPKKLLILLTRADLNIASVKEHTKRTNPFPCTYLFKRATISSRLGFGGMKALNLYKTKKELSRFLSKDREDNTAEEPIYNLRLRGVFEP